MFTGPLCLEAETTPDEWTLSEPLTWRDEAGQITVPRGFVTDLASIPKVLRNVLDVNGRSRRAAVLHDWLYCLQDRERAAADRLLRDALIAEGEGDTTAWTYWAGVRVGGWLPWSRKGLNTPNPQDFASTDAYLKWRGSR